MICDSRARRGSRRAGIVLSLALLAAGTAAAQEQELGWPPALRLPADRAHEPVLAAHLDEDRAWLRRQPSWLLVAPAPADSNAVLAWLRRGEQRRRDVADTLTVRGREPARGQRSLLAELRDRWLARGHLDAAVALRGAGGDVGRAIVVAPGRLYRLAALEVTGDPFPQRARLLAAWLPEPGDVFRPAAYREAAAGVVAECAELGFPFPAWITQRVETDRAAGEVTVAAALVPGPRSVVGPQTTNLPPGRSSRFVVRAAGLASGEPFRESDLRRGVDRLLARDLYARVDAPLVHLTTSRDTVGVVWRVQPRERRNRVAVVLGVSRQDDGGTRLSGQVELDLPDLAGTGRRLSARWHDDGAERSEFAFSYLEPLILGTPLDTDLTLASEVQEDSYTRFRIDNRWRMSVVALWGVEVGLGWDRNTFPAGDLERTTRTRGRVALLHGRGDRTRSGWSAALAVETVSRTTARRRADGGDGGPADLGSENSQRLLEADVAGEFWLSSTLSLAGRASFRQIDTDVRPVPLPEQYRFGGAASLRGYREEEFHGETAAWGGIEVRLGGARRSRVYTFVDVGYFEFSRVEPGTDDLATRDGTELGFGLGLLTAAAAGEIDLAVGFPSSVDFDTAKLHVSLVGGF